MLEKVYWNQKSHLLLKAVSSGEHGEQGGPSEDWGVERAAKVTGWASKKGENRSASFTSWLVSSHNYIMKGSLSCGKPYHPADLHSTRAQLILKERKKVNGKRLKEIIFNFKHSLNMIESNSKKSWNSKNTQGLGEMPWLKVLQWFPYLSALFLNTQSLCLINTSL